MELKATLSIYSFQSLIGIQYSCNCGNMEQSKASLRKFQSLIGIQYSCNFVTVFNVDQIPSFNP